MNQNTLLKSKSFNDYSILRKLPLQHQLTIQEPDYSEIDRTTSYESIPYGRSFDQTTMRRSSASSKDDLSTRKDSYITFEANDTTLSIGKLKGVQK